MRTLTHMSGKLTWFQTVNYLILFKLQILVDSVRINTDQQQLTDALANVCYIDIRSLVTVDHALDLYVTPDHAHKPPPTVKPILTIKSKVVSYSFFRRCFP